MTVEPTDFLPPSKDFWDKLEISAKFLGAVLVPAAVATSVYLYNSQSSTLQSKTSMTNIAIEVLTSTHPNATIDRTLRKWAVEVLRSPDDPPKLTPEAATELLNISFSGEILNKGIDGWLIDLKGLPKAIGGSNPYDASIRAFEEIAKERSLTQNEKDSLDFLRAARAATQGKSTPVVRD